MKKAIQPLQAPRCGPVGRRLIGRITQDALRRAALAPTYAEALDITGAALVAVAMVSRAEVPA